MLVVCSVVFKKTVSFIYHKMCMFFSNVAVLFTVIELQQWFRWKNVSRA